MAFSPIWLLHALWTDMLALNYLSKNSPCLIVNGSDIISFNHFILSRRHSCPTTPFPLYFAIVFVSHFTPRCKSLSLINVHNFPGAIQNISVPALSPQEVCPMSDPSLWSVNDYPKPTSTFSAGYADFELHMCALGFVEEYSSYSYICIQTLFSCL